MARKGSRNGALKKFDYPFTVEVRAVEFEPHALIAYVDVNRLRSGTHRVDVGLARAGRCSRKVFASVRKGMVTGIELEPCEENGPKLSREALGVVREAYRRMGRRARARWKPVPVRDFFSSPAAARTIIISWGDWCMQVCWTSGTGTTMTCVQCCLWPPNCRIDTIVVGPL